MSKIKEIHVVNYKAIKDTQIRFEGCSAIVTGRNDAGKSSLLKGLPDRIRGEKPEIILREEECEGFFRMELTTGEVFEWNFAKTGKNKDIKEKLVFITKDNQRNDITANLKSGVCKSLCEKFFPPVFDIDTFLLAEPKKQSAMLQKLIGIDFATIDAEYAIAYNDRTEKHKKAKEKENILASIKAKLQSEGIDTDIEPVELIDITLLQKQISDIKDLNTSISLKQQEIDNNKEKLNSLNQKLIDDDISFDKSISDYLGQIAALQLKIENAKNEKHTVKTNNLTQISAIKEVISERETELATFPVIDNEGSEDLNKRFADAVKNNELHDKIANMNAAQEELTEANKDWVDSEKSVSDIIAKKKAIINTANLPSGFSFDANNNILVDNLPLDKKQLSSSKVYISALRLASLVIGSVETLYFDASTLDGNSLSKILEWTNENGLQLLVERPDYDCGEIRVELIVD